MLPMTTFGAVARWSECLQGTACGCIAAVDRVRSRPSPGRGELSEIRGGFGCFGGHARSTGVSSIGLPFLGGVGVFGA